IDFAERLRHGDVALTDDQEAGGTDAGATPVNGTWDPLNLPWLVLPAWLAPAYSKLLELVVSVGATYLFCRRIGLRPAPGWLAGIAFSATGFQVAWTNWPHPQAG